MQKIFPEALNSVLEKELKSVYFLTGQDLLLVDESKEAIINQARSQEFDEKLEINVANDTNWDDLFDQLQSTGLFFSRQIVVLNLPENITANYQKRLLELVGLIHSDLLLIFHFPKFTKAIEKQKWIAEIANQAVQVTCQTPDISKLPVWLSHRTKAMELTLTEEAKQQLCFSYEGNLLALKQALQLLQLRFPDGKISLPRVNEIIENSAQFTPFQWIDALLEGNVRRAIRILHHLKNEDVQPVVLLRIIQKELLVLINLTRTNLQNSSTNQPLVSQNLRAEFDRLKIWQNRRGAYQNAIQRMSYRKLFLLCQNLAELERKVKAEFSDEIWLELERFSSQFK